ncbi:MAG: hypothetical protein AB7O80_16325 [Acetobacteraceae bacterium]
MSGSRGQHYQRVILELGQGDADPDTIRFVAEFARELGLDLHGLFVEDESLLNLAALPFAREIRLPTHQWQPIDADRMADELRHAADAARLRLQQVVAALGVRSRFEVVRGDPHLCVAGLCFPTDIVVVTETMTAPAMRSAAESSPASVLLLPKRATYRHGPVVAVTAQLDDPGLDLAEHIAHAQHAPLVILHPAAAAGERRGADLFGMADLSATSVLRTLAPLRERLVIVTRGAARELPMADVSQIVTTRHDAVLLL